MNFTRLSSKYAQHRAFIVSSVILFVGNFVMNIMNYVYHLVVGRNVSPQVYGEAESLISLIAIVSVPAGTLLLVSAKYAAACKAEKSSKGTRELWIFLSKKVIYYGFPLLLFILILTPFIGDFLQIDNNIALAVMWISMFLSFFAAVNQGILKGWQEFSKYSWVGILSTFAKFIFGVLFIWLGFELYGIIGSIVLSSLVGYVATYVFLRKRVAKKSQQENEYVLKKSDLDSLRRYIFPVFAGNLAVTLLGNVDMVVAKSVLGAVEAGQYAALMIVSKIILYGSGIVSVVLFAMSAEKNHKGDSSKSMLFFSIFLVSVASFCAVLLYYFYPKFVLGLLFGGKYEEVSLYLVWFAIPMGLFAILNVIFTYLLSQHKTRISYALLALSTVFTGVLFFYATDIVSFLKVLIGAHGIALIVSCMFLFRKEKSDSQSLKTSVENLLPNN